MSTIETIPHPEVASREEWLIHRKALLAQEKEVTRQKDRVAAERRRLPMVKLEKTYEFEGPNGIVKLVDLFEGQPQLIIYHFMFDPEWEMGCMGCTGFVNAQGDMSLLKNRQTTFALVSRAPLAKLLAFKEKQGWALPWYSSFGSDFNYDFHVTQNQAIAPVEYNYEDKAALRARRGSGEIVGEEHGLSVFFALGGEVYHTYSTYGRGVESLTDTYALLDVTPYGRQEDWEDSPAGWPQRPTYG